MWRRCSALLLLPALFAFACGGDGTSQETFPLCADDPGPAPLRRITRFEYGRTLSDLTGVAASIADRLPPDEETLGFDDIATAYSVSSLHAAAYLDAAELAAATLAGDGARLAAVAGCDPTTGDATCVGSFIDGFGRRAWRRPLEPDELQAMQQLYTDTADPGPADGVAGVVAAMLQAPQFLYRPEPNTATDSQPLEPYALATRLSLLLTGAGPDEALLTAAGSGGLDTEAGLLAQTDRLLADPRAAELFVHVVTQWWELGGVPALDKDRSLYRTWTDATPGALAEETRQFLTDTWQGTPSITALLTAPVTFVDADLASFYGLPAPGGTGFQRVDLDPTRAAGLLTQGSFLAEHAKADQTSPVLRGKFVRAQLLCDPPPPPPPDIVVMPPTVDPRLSTRQRFAQHTADQRCASCHAEMDPIGFTFEHYDAAGRWRDMDGGQAVDATGMLTGTDVDGPLDGVPSLAMRLAGSAQVADCAATQWFRYAFGRQEVSTGDVCTIEKLTSALRSGDFKKMVRATVRMAAFRNQPPETAP
jgi:Protein of unknown function (DUF1588)/Protein of unknown function (DUF1592)/Protein of unknown function (DUF1587)/Protein of unknown function (DUF1595)/Protein of unknown function (DUF1585)